MQETIIKISDKIYLVQIAETEEEREIGLSKTEKLDQDSGMLFVIPEGQSQVAFTMEDMSYDLDLIFINEDDEVYDVQYGKAGSKDPIISTSEDIVKYVLEVNPNSDIKVGDELEFTDCPDCEEVDEEEVNKMYVITEYIDDFYTERYYFKKKENAIEGFKNVIKNFYKQNKEIFCDLCEELFEENRTFEDFLNECVEKGYCDDVTDIELIEWEDE